MFIKQVVFCLSLFVGLSTSCVSLMATNTSPVEKNSSETAQKIKNLKIERKRLQLRARILQDSADRKLTQDWIGYRMVVGELDQVEKRIQEIDTEIQELEKQK